MTDPLAVVEATWPAAATRIEGPWLLREGRGGGKRVSAATAEGAWRPGDIALAEAAQARLGQPALFLIRPEEAALDAELARCGFALVDPVVILSAPVAGLASTPPRPLSAFCHWPPLAIQRELWAEGGIGPARLAVMERVGGPHTAILGRAGDRAAGAAFVAVAGSHAMLHALHVGTGQRRQGVARNIMRAAAAWAQHHGAIDFSVAVTRGNPPANALYSSLGMQVVGHYHYRMKVPEEA